MRDAADWTPESSRRARAFTVYAALRSLGREGVAELVDRCCDLAQRFAAGDRPTCPAATVLNEVVINQVLVPLRGRHNDAIRARRASRQSGEAWMGGTTWQGRPAIRVLPLLELEDDEGGHRPHRRRLRRRRS